MGRKGIRRRWLWPAAAFFFCAARVSWLVWNEWRNATPKDMPLLNRTAFTGPAPPANVTTEQWSATIADQIHRGIITYPTATTVVQRACLFVPAGMGEDSFTLTDADIAKLEPFAAFGDPAYDDAAEQGMVMLAAAPRDSAAAVWTGGLASGGPGEDDYGGPNSNADIAGAWAVMMELGIGVNNQVVNPFKAAAMGYSGGAMRILTALRAGSFRPAAVILRAPLTDIYDWNSLPGTNKEKIAEKLGFTADHIANATTIKFKELERSEQDSLQDRSAAHWVKELPYIKYFVQRAEKDTKVDPAKTQRWYDLMVAAGHDITMLTCPTADHGFTTSTMYGWSIAMSRMAMGISLA